MRLQFWNSRAAALATGLTACLVGLFSGQSALAAGAIRIGMIPDAGATQVSVEQKAPLQAYLQKAIGRKVVLVIPTSYNATVEGLDNGSLDVAYLGGLTYVKAHARADVIPLVQRKEDREFHALFITHPGTGITKLSDLKGKQFAFGDINSTSGHLMPYLAMLKAGIDPASDLSFRYTGSHAATIKAVEAGVVDAGACDETVLHSMIEEHKVDPHKVIVFYTTPAFVDYVWVARKGLPKNVREAVAQAFLSLRPGKDDAILNILRGKRFVRANNHEYAAIRTVAKKLSMF